MIGTTSGNAWEGDPDWEALVRHVASAIASSASRHPGAVAEAVVSAVVTRFELTPREGSHTERRRNHEERIRWFAHEVFLILGSGNAVDPAREIAARVLGSFLLTALASGRVALTD